MAACCLVRSQEVDSLRSDVDRPRHFAFEKRELWRRPTSEQLLPHTNLTLPQVDVGPQRRERKTFEVTDRMVDVGNADNRTGPQ